MEDKLIEHEWGTTSTFVIYNIRCIQSLNIYKEIGSHFI